MVRVAEEVGGNVSPEYKILQDGMIFTFSKRS